MKITSFPKGRIKQKEFQLQTFYAQISRVAIGLFWKNPQTLTQNTCETVWKYGSQRSNFESNFPCPKKNTKSWIDKNPCV